MTTSGSPILKWKPPAITPWGGCWGHEILSVNAILANRIENKFSKNPAKVIDGLIMKVLDRI